jgi:hypothetical protein
METSGRDFLEEIGLRAAQNEAFKKALLEDPKTAVETRLQAKLPKNLKITVVEEKPDELFIVIPQKSNTELSDDQLEVIAGGKGICWKNPSCVCMTTCAIR